MQSAGDWTFKSNLTGILHLLIVGGSCWDGRCGYYRHVCAEHKKEMLATHVLVRLVYLIRSRHEQKYELLQEDVYFINLHMYLQFFTLAINRNFTNWFPSIVLPIRSTMDTFVFDIFLHIDTLISSIHHFSITLQLYWTIALPMFPLGFDNHLN